MLRIEFNNECQITCVDSSGNAHLIPNPFVPLHAPVAADTLLPNDYIYYGATILDSCHVELHFVRLNPDYQDHRSWLVNDKGCYVSQRDSSPALRRAVCIDHRLDFFTSLEAFVSIAKKFLNDLQIYCLLRDVLRSPSEASYYIDSHAPTYEDPHSNMESLKDEGPNVHLLVLYNHCYTRNIHDIETIYHQRFSSIHHLIPCAGPAHPRVIVFPFGSFQYHLALYHALSLVAPSISAKDYILIVQDDVMLHPSVDERSICQRFSSSDILYYHDLSLIHDSGDQWCWNLRVQNSCIQQKDPLLGNGFEGCPAFFDKRSFTRGIGDVFGLRVNTVGHFLDVLSHYVSANVFPEVAIPTSLRYIRDRHGLSVGLFQGLYLWGEDRALVEDGDWMRKEFIDSDLLFLHPVKLAKYIHLASHLF